MSCETLPLINADDTDPDGTKVRKPMLYGIGKAEDELIIRA